MKRSLFTKEGFDKLKAEQQTLFKKRKETVENLRRAREMGDLSENGYYKAAKFELGQIDRRLRQVKFLLQTALVTTASQKDKVEVGSSVTVQMKDEQKTYSIVGDFEANPVESKLSSKSPIGKALIGRKIGEKVQVTTPRETIELLVMSIS